MRRRFAFVFVALLACGATPVHAAPAGRHFECSQLTGFTTYDRTPNELTHHTLKDAIHFGARLGYGWGPAWALEAGVGFTPTQEDRVNGLSLDDVPVSLAALWSPLRTRALWPYLLAGGAASTLRRDGGGGSDRGNAALVGAGLRYWLNDAVGLRIEASDQVSLEKNSIGHNHSQAYVVAAGFAFAF